MIARFRFELFGLAALAACAPYRLVVSAAPDPFARPCVVAVEPIDYRGMQVGAKNVDSWQAAKNDAQVASFEVDKNETSASFLDAVVREEYGVFRAPAPTHLGTVYTVVPRMVFYEPGFFIGIMSMPTRAVLMAWGLDPGGKVLDQVELRAEIEGTFANASSGSRMRAAGAQLGVYFSSYLHNRVRCR